MLAFAITIHKCQGLSLTSAIIDLSDSIFCAGMAYVALSRVRTMDGLHLTKFDPIAIKVSVVGNLLVTVITVIVIIDYYYLYM